MSKRILGLDIRHDSISAVLISSGIKGAVIEAHAYVPIADQNDRDSFLSSSPEIASSLEVLLEKMDISGSVCVASFPADQISFRNIKVPFKAQKKIRKVLPYELEPTLPFPEDGLIIDFFTVKLPETKEHTDLVAAAVEKTRLQSYLDTLAAFDIEPEIVTVGGYSTALCLANLVDMHENWLCVDLDKKKGVVFAILAGGISLIRSVPAPSDAPSSKTEMLGANIYRTLSAFETFYDINFQLDGIFVTGSGLDDPEIEQDLARILELPVQRTNLVGDTKITHHHSSEQPWVPHRMDNAFSLALMGIEGIDGLNFRKGPFAAKKFWVEHKKNIIKSGCFAALVLVLAFFNVVLESYFLEKKLTRVNSQIAEIFTSTFPEVKKIVEPYQQMQVKINEMKKNTLFSEDTGQRIRAIDILYNISNLIPNETDVDINRLVIGGEGVQISGITNTMDSVDDMKSRLEQANVFKTITISSANRDKSDNRVRFKLKVQL
jgi:type II secretion system protein L